MINLLLNLGKNLDKEKKQDAHADASVSIIGWFILTSFTRQVNY